MPARWFVPDLASPYDTPALGLAGRLLHTDTCRGHTLKSQLISANEQVVRSDQSSETTGDAVLGRMTITFHAYGSGRRQTFGVPQPASGYAKRQRNRLAE